MNHSTKPYLDYNDENLPVSLDIIPGPDFYSTSPDYSESTSAKNTYSLSPEMHGYIHTNDQFPVDTWAYEGDFLLQGAEGYQNAQTPLSNETDEKLCKKSKRISKRAVAKERTKAKQETTSIFKGVDLGSGSDGVDEPALDEKGKKKQVQKMRNRISAQNSRDRKKAYAQQLEEMNGKLTEENSNLLREKDILLQEISQLKYSESQLLKENQQLRNNMCASCTHQGFTLNQDTEQNLIDYGTSGFSNLASPILSRFPSGKGVLSFLTFAAVVSCVVVLNLPQNKEIVLQGPVVPQFKDTGRMLELIDNETIQKIETYEIQHGQNYPIVSPYLLQNMEPLKNYFNENFELLFKKHLQATPILNAQWGMYETIQSEEEPEPQNALTMYQDPKIANLRKVPTIITQNLPIIEEEVEDQPMTSTLFCPSALEFDNNRKTLEFSQNRLKERDLNLQKSEYLQLFVPRNRVANLDVRNMTYSYDSLVPADENDNSMLEIWCKVFLVREINSNL